MVIDSFLKIPVLPPGIYFLEWIKLVLLSVYRKCSEKKSVYRKWSESYTSVYTYPWYPVSPYAMALDVQVYKGEKKTLRDVNWGSTLVSAVQFE
jgi:hypothetical protein